MDVGEVVALIAGIASGVLATAAVVRTKVLPPLAEAARLTAVTWDDDIIEAVDETLSAVERNLRRVTGAEGSSDALRGARREALDMLGVDEGDDVWDEREG